VGEPWGARGWAPAAAVRTLVEAQAWLRAAASPERAPALLNPSRVAAASVTNSGEATRREGLEAGRLSHALLQYLPDIAPDQRRDAAQRFLAGHGPEAPIEGGGAIIERVLSVIGDERLAALFGPRSRAEVEIAAAVPRPGRVPIAFAGRIDRLAVDENGVLIADFKSGAARSRTPPQYLAQLALYRAALAPLYPGRPLRAFLVWLDYPDIEEIDPGALDAALANLLTAM
jgi:ATP-dependent helicase/nuclease subunit A